MKNYELTVSPADAGLRLDQFLKRAIPGQSRALSQKLIREGACEIDGRATLNADRKISAGEKITLRVQTPTPLAVPEEGETRVLWHDEHLAVIAKPAGLTVHPCPSQTSDTLIQRLLSRFPQLAAQGGWRPGVVHRLDKDTSGLVIVALSETARLELTRAFAEREIQKEYLALVYGSPPAEGAINAPLGRHPTLKTRMTTLPEKKGGKPANTSWRKLWSAPGDKISLLSVKIATGRTHQIRVHLAHRGFPIIGDQTYAAGEAKTLAPRQALHAWKLRFYHPVTGELMRFLLPPPEDFTAPILAYGLAPRPIVVTGNQGCGKSSFCRHLADMGFTAIDADKIVAELYSGPSPASDWFKIRGLTKAINRKGGLEKNELLKIFTAKPEIKEEFVKYVWRLVGDSVRESWLNARPNEAIITEIPLYFEAGMQKTLPAFTLVVTCDEKKRHDRIRATRGWPDAKIREIESWQLAEAKKTALADCVVKNDGDEATLRDEAEKFAAFLARDGEEKLKELQDTIGQIYESRFPRFVF